MSVGVWHTDTEGRLGRDRLIRKGKYSEQEQFAPLHNRPARKTKKKKKKKEIIWRKAGVFVLRVLGQIEGISA